MYSESNRLTQGLNKNGNVRLLDLKALFEAFRRKKMVAKNCDVDPQLFINHEILSENIKISYICYVKESTALFKCSYFILCPFTLEALELLTQATLKVTNGFGFVSFISVVDVFTISHWIGKHVKLYGSKKVAG